MLKLCLQRSLFYSVLMLTGELLSCVFPLESSTVTLRHAVRPWCVSVCASFAARLCLWTKCALSLSLCFTVILLATSPAYFRGFTLIALKEGREGTTDDDYTGQFQVRTSRCGGGERESHCILNARRAFWESSQKINSFACCNAHGSRLGCSPLSSDMEVKGGVADRCSTAPLDEDGRESSPVVAQKKRELPLCSSRARHPPHWGAGTSSRGGKRKGRRKERKRHVRTDKQRVQGKAGDRSEMFGSVVTQLPLSGTELLRREPDFLNYLLLSVNRNTHL